MPTGCLQTPDTWLTVPRHKLSSVDYPRDTTIPALELNSFRRHSKTFLFEYYLELSIKCISYYDHALYKLTIYLVTYLLTLSLLIFKNHSWHNATDKVSSYILKN